MSRFLPYLRRAVQALVRRYAPTYLYVSSSVNAGAASRSGSGSSTNPALVTRDFNIAFYNMPLVNSIRDLKMDKIGQLISISGTVTRTSEVRPELVSGTFRCEACKTVISDVEQQFKFTEVSTKDGLANCRVAKGYIGHRSASAKSLPKHNVFQSGVMATSH